MLFLSELSWECCHVFKFPSVFQLQLQCTFFALCLLNLIRKENTVLFVFSSFFPSLWQQIRCSDLDRVEVTSHFSHTLKPSSLSQEAPAFVFFWVIREISNCEITQGMGSRQHKETGVIWHVRTYRIPYFCDRQQIYPCKFKSCVNFLKEEKQEFILEVN